jgi:succinyl-diaminopimelate desuccinylase
LVVKLGAAGVRAIKVKQAWTDVARFDRAGVPGANLGPGTAAQAHQRNEHTDLGALTEGYRIFERFLTTPRAIE